MRAVRRIESMRSRVGKHMMLVLLLIFACMVVCVQSQEELPIGVCTAELCVSEQSCFLRPEDGSLCTSAWNMKQSPLLLLLLLLLYLHECKVSLPWSTRSFRSLRFMRHETDIHETRPIRRSVESTDLNCVHFVSYICVHFCLTLYVRILCS